MRIENRQCLVCGGRGCHSTIYETDIERCINCDGRGFLRIRIMDMPLEIAIWKARGGASEADYLDVDGVECAALTTYHEGEK